MCLQRSPSVARWPSGSQRATCSIPLGNATECLDLKYEYTCTSSKQIQSSNNQLCRYRRSDRKQEQAVLLLLSSSCVVQHGCVVTAPATTAPRARALAAACLALALAALCLAARCYASSTQLHPQHPHHRFKRSPVTTATTTSSTILPPPPYTVTNNTSTATSNNRSHHHVSSARVSHSTIRPMPSLSGSLPQLPEHHKHPTNTVSGGGGSSTSSSSVSSINSINNINSISISNSGGSKLQPELVEQHNNRSGGSGLVALVVGATLLTATLGLITCVVSHYRGGGGGGGEAGGAPPPPPPPPPHHAHHHQHHHHHVTAPMLSVMSASAAAGVGVAAAGDGGRLHRHVGSHVSRELAAQRDRQVRLHSVHTDLELDLPPSIALPDGEELPYGSSARLHIRDPEQESEIYQKCIRAPPNRTVFESESPPPYRSSSAGLLGSLGSSSSSGTSDWSGGSTPLVVRCHSMSSSSAKSTLHPQQYPHQHPHPHPHHHSSAQTPAPATSSQKTDFLQRTVKILTGRKSNNSSSGSGNSSQPPAPAPTLPVVVVPARPRRLDPRSPQ